MKRLIFTTLCVLAHGLAIALPVGNPAEASLLCSGLLWEGACYDPCNGCVCWCDVWNFRAGFYGDYNWNRHMEIDGPAHADIEHTQLFTNAGYVALNFCDRLDLFTSLGATNIFISTNALTFNGASSIPLEIETETTFSWSVGARATLWQCGCTMLGIEAQYFSTRPNISRVTELNVGSVYPNGFEARYHEWQVGIGISHRISMFVPYVAIKGSGSKLKMDDALPLGVLGGVTLRDLENKHYFGYAVGVTLVDCEKASLTVEGRWPDEKALYVNGQIRF